MTKSLKLLLIENVDSLGIVGDVVSVRSGYARNFLIPRALATQPSEDKVKELASRRVTAQKQVEDQRSGRIALNEKLKGVELTLVRACNDMGILYGAVTQQDLAAALKEQGFHVLARDVRIPQTIKRIDHFDIHIKLDSDLDQTVKVHIKPDRELANNAAGAPGAEGAEGAGPAGAGADDRPSRRRDQWALPDDSNRVVGWGSGKKEDKKEDGKRSEKKSDGGDTKDDKKSEKKHDKNDDKKADKKADKKSSKKAE